MKKLKLISQLTVCSALAILTMSSCAWNRIEIQHDKVKSLDRVKAQYNFFQTEERRSPMQCINQSILKQINTQNKATYTFYDAVNLNHSNYQLEDTIYLFIGKEVFPLPVSFQRNNAITSLTENTRTILTADSTRVPILTGLALNNKNLYHLSYEVPANVMQKILSEDEIMYRYYFGHEMVTARLKGMNLKKLKRVILH